MSFTARIEVRTKLEKIAILYVAYEDRQRCSRQAADRAAPMIEVIQEQAFERISVLFEALDIPCSEIERCYAVINRKIAELLQARSRIVRRRFYPAWAR